MEKGKALLFKLLMAFASAIPGAMVTIVIAAFFIGGEWNEYTTMKDTVKTTSESVTSISNDVSFIKGKLSN